MSLLGRDKRAEEELLKPVVYLVTFVAVSSLLVGFLIQFYQENAFGGEADYETGYDTIGGITYDMLDPAEGYTITDEYVCHYVNLDDFLYYEFEDVKVQYVRDNTFFAPWSGFNVQEYRDFFWLKVSYGWWTIKVRALPFEVIRENYQSDTNTSINDLTMGSRSYTVFIQAAGSTLDFEQALENNALNISIGVNLEDQLAHNSMWSTLGQVLTMQLPDTHWIINLLIAIPMWTAIGVLAFIVIKGLAPW